MDNELHNAHIFLNGDYVVFHPDKKFGEVWIYVTDTPLDDILKEEEKP